MSNFISNKLSSISRRSTKRRNFLRQFRDEKSMEFKQLTATQFIEIWNHYDSDGNGYIESKELDDFLRDFTASISSKGNSKELLPDCMLKELKSQFMDAYDEDCDGKISVHELADILPMEESFLLLFRRDNPLESSVEFMKVWREFDKDCSGYIEADELKQFIKRLIETNTRGPILEEKLIEYADTIDCSQLNQQDLEKAFSLYDKDNNGYIEQDELDGFVKDLLELVKNDYDSEDLNDFKRGLLAGCDLNRDNKISKTELKMVLLALSNN